MPPTVISALLPDTLDGVNFSRGRGGCPYPIDCVTIHCTEGDAASVRAWFRNPAARVSAHYMITKSGSIVQFVAESDKAYHAGQLVGPTAPLVVERYANGHWTPNSYGIGIECESNGNEDLTERQRTALYDLMADIIERRTIPLDRLHVFGHREVKQSKSCPGPISVDRIVADLAAMVAPKAPIIAARPPIDAPTADIPRIVWSNVLKDYVVVVRYQDDTNWWYRTLASLDDDRAMKAGAPLSAFPLTRPAA